MMLVSETHIVLNPAAAGGRLGKRVEAIVRTLKSHISGPCSVHLTRTPGDATRLARIAMQNGAASVIAAGGERQKGAFTFSAETSALLVGVAGALVGTLIGGVIGASLGRDEIVGISRRNRGQKLAVLQMVMLSKSLSIDKQRDWSILSLVARSAGQSVAYVEMKKEKLINYGEIDHAYT